MISGLNTNKMLQEATDRTGLADFGDDSFRKPLDVLVSALNNEANLNDAGVLGQQMRITELLVNRLQVEEWFRRFPAIEDEVIIPPVAIVGLPRTGTTLLHRTLASDTRFFAPYWYETRFPAPEKDWSFSQKTDNRIVAAKAEVAAMLEANPDIAAIHPMNATGADEELMLLEHSFFSTTPMAFAYLPSYQDWLETHDNSPGYLYLKRLLKFLQWQKKASGQEGKRWLLKTPHHLHHMDLLLKTFPGIQVLQTHRDPLQTIPSVCSFHHALYKLAADNPSAQQVGQQWSEKFAKGMRHTMSVRQNSPESFFDVFYQDTVTEPEKVVNDVYNFIGWNLGVKAKEAMQAYRAENAREKRQEHHYSMSDFALTEQGIKEQFFEYRKRYIKKRLV